MNPWAIVAIAGLMETGWALGLKYSEGFTRLLPSVVTVVLALGSFYLLSVAMKSLPVGTVIAAVFLFQEPVNLMRVVGVLLILAGIAALKFA